MPVCVHTDASGDFPGGRTKGRDSHGGTGDTETTGKKKGRGIIKL